MSKTLLQMENVGVFVEQPVVFLYYITTILSLDKQVRNKQDLITLI